LTVPSDFVVPFTGESYVALIWGNISFHANERQEVAKALIDSGCRYVVCGGQDCEAWHDETDMVWAMLSVELGQGLEMPAVMTSWHNNESEEDVVYFAFNLTNFDEHEFNKYLVLMIGSDHSEERRIEELIEAIQR
jgi:hypothetical protein